MEEDTKELIERIEKISRVIDWEDDVGVWREMKEDEWQTLKKEFEAK